MSFAYKPAPPKGYRSQLIPEPGVDPNARWNPPGVKPPTREVDPHKIRNQVAQAAALRRRASREP